MAEDDQPTSFQTSQEESLRQAQAAFGGSGSPESALGTATPSAPVGVPGVQAPRRWLRRLVVFVLIVGPIAAVIIGGYLLIKSAVDDATTPDRTIPSIPSLPGVPSVPTTPKRPSSPGAPSSNFSLAGLARAKGTAQRLAGRGARIELARVTEDQLQVIALAGSRRKVVIVSSGLTRAIESPGTGGLGTFTFAELRPAALARLLGGLRRTYHVSASKVDYIVLIRNPVTKSLQWLAYPRGGAGHFQADAAGGSLRRVG